MSTDTKPFKGSCHCGFVKYTVNIPTKILDNPSALKCNCTWCQKGGITNLQVGAGNFTLDSPASKSEMGDYSPKGDDGQGNNVHRYFCKTCGSQIMREGSYMYEGQKVEFCGVNIVTLDQPQDGLELSDFKISYFDGFHDNWTGGLQDKPWKAGVP